LSIFRLASFAISLPSMLRGEAPSWPNHTVKNSFHPGTNNPGMRSVWECSLTGGAQALVVGSGGVQELCR
jgi:hypothetical protein